MGAAYVVRTARSHAGMRDMQLFVPACLPESNVVTLPDAGCLWNKT